MKEATPGKAEIHNQNKIDGSEKQAKSKKKSSITRSITAPVPINRVSFPPRYGALETSVQDSSSQARAITPDSSKRAIKWARHTASQMRGCPRLIAPKKFYHYLLWRSTEKLHTTFKIGASADKSGKLSAAVWSKRSFTLRSRPEHFPKGATRHRWSSINKSTMVNLFGQPRIVSLKTIQKGKFLACPPGGRNWTLQKAGDLRESLVDWRLGEQRLLGNASPAPHAISPD